MDQKKKGALVGVIVCIVAMFLWIFLTAFLTGEREISDFTTRDKYIFAGFIVVEVLTCVALGYYTHQAAKANRPTAEALAEMQKNVPKRGAWLLAGALALSLAVNCIGIAVRPHLTEAAKAPVAWSFGICCAIPPVLAGISMLLSAWTTRKLRGKNVRQLQAFLLSHREDAAQTAKEKLAVMKRLRRLTDIYAAAFLVWGLGIAFCGGLLPKNGFTVPICFYGAFVLNCALIRIRFKTVYGKKAQTPAVMEETEYPTIYGLARKAAEKLGVEGRISISLDGGMGAGVRPDGDTTLVYLGVTLLSVMTEDELYAVLLHEFSHVAMDLRDGSAERAYAEWLDGEGNPNFLSGLTNLLYLYLDSRYGLEFALYSYASSVIREAEADRAMAAYGSAAAAGSLLIKLKYSDLHEWEAGTLDREPLCAPEEPTGTHLEEHIQRFHDAIRTREPEWRKLINVEILSRSASHPTVKMRLEELGVTDYSVTVPEHTGAYGEEYRKALQQVQTILVEGLKENYEEERLHRYLKPLEAVEAWEAAGKPLVAEEYADIHDALRMLGRNREADALCQRVISELSGAACDHAHFMHGCFLLGCYDPRGLEHIYRAIEGNSNYIEEGLSMIGDFCCLTGDQEELDTYREKAMELAQKDRDVYSQLSVLKKTDKLSAEQLPEGMLEDILGYIAKVEKGSIANIYLVRKTITESFFASVFIVRFREDAGEEVCNEVMHRIFSYLDTCSDWQFSLFEYSDVASVKPEAIPNSCVYTAKG